MFNLIRLLAKTKPSRTTCDFFANCHAAALRRSLVAIFAAMLILVVGTLQSIGEELAPAHAELSLLREKIFAAYEARNLDELLKNVHPEVIATWQNGFRARGHEEVRAFYNEMLNGDKRIVRDVKSKLTVDGLSVLHGDNAAVACGSLADQFVLASGSNLDLQSKWTATIVKRDDQWLVASFHVSSSVFDNPVMAAVQSWLTKCIIGAAIVVLIIGAIVGFLIARRKSSKMSATHAG